MGKTLPPTHPPTHNTQTKQAPSGSTGGGGPGSSPSGGPTQLEMDEALARQLQRAEMDGISTPLILGAGGQGSGSGSGGGLGGPGHSGGSSQGGGLGTHGRQGSTDEARQTRLNALHNVREVRSASFALCIVLLVNIPQIIAAVIILAKNWDDQTCISSETAKWKTYALIAALRMFFYVSTVTAMYQLNGRLTLASPLMRFLSHARNGLDAFGLIWFVVGNMWLFGGDVEICPHPNRSPLYTLCVAMVFINYAQLCLPCVVVIVMLPVLCFCLPCLIRILARIQDPMRGKGATPTMINKLPLMKYRQIQAQATAQSQAAATAGQAPTPSVTGVESNSTSCAICISEYAPEEDIRLLPCAHYFHNSVRLFFGEGGWGGWLSFSSSCFPLSTCAHPPTTHPQTPTQCVDEWLKVNASCPTCRASILPDHPDTPNPRYGTTGISSSTSSGGSAGSSPNSGGGMDRGSGSSTLPVHPGTPNRAPPTAGRPTGDFLV